MPDRPEFRWGHAVLHALVALVLTVVVTGTLAFTLDVADPRRFGQGVGRFSLFMMLGALGASWLFQTGRRAAAAIVSGLLLSLLAILVAMVIMVDPGLSGSLPDDDLLRLDDRLHHPTLGFTIPDPGPNLDENSELAATYLPSDRDSRAWVYEDRDLSEVVIVILAGRAATDAQTFEDFFTGVLRGQTSAMEDAAVVADERERSIRWADRRAHAYVIMAGEIHLRVDAFGLPGGEAMVLISASQWAKRFERLAAGVGAAPQREGRN